MGRAALATAAGTRARCTLAHRGVRRGEAVRRGRERRGRVVVVVVVVARSSPFPDGRRGRGRRQVWCCARWRRWASWRSRSPSFAGAGCGVAATATRWSGAGRSGSGTSTARWASTCTWASGDARRLARRELERAELERAEAAAAAAGRGTGRGGKPGDVRDRGTHVGVPDAGHGRGHAVGR